MRRPAWRSGLEVFGLGAEPAVDVALGQIGVPREHLRRQLARPVEQQRVGREVGKAQQRGARLARAQKLARPANLEIARRDLEIRGPGEFLGARQSGAPLLRFADLATDTLLLDWARELAPVMLQKHPELAQRHIDRWLGTKAEYLKA